MEKLTVLSLSIKNNIKKLLNNNLKSLNLLNNLIKKSSYICINKKSSGRACAIAGLVYEKIVHSVVKKCKIKNKNIYFNTQKEDDLGGWGADNDIICNFNRIGDIPIEIKKKRTPDWMQCCLKFINNKWCCAPNSKIPEKSRTIFENIINNINLYNGEIPPFMTKKITHFEWVKIKKETGKFKDFYMNIGNDTIKKVYTEKGCKYIQISGKGLYHLGDDICNFKVPEFICDQELRIRTKIHKRKDKKGFCHLSVMAACKPKNINSISDSKFSLDDKNKLPNNLIYL